LPQKNRALSQCRRIASDRVAGVGFREVVSNGEAVLIRFQRAREFALRLRDRKTANIVQTSPDLAATGNIGCIAQFASGTSIPVLHTIELLDFAHGGPRPDGLASLAG
jgi:hypothetical protein